MAFWPVAILMTSLGMAVIGESQDHPGYATMEECLPRLPILSEMLSTRGIGPIKPDMIQGGRIGCVPESAESVMEKIRAETQKPKGQEI